MTSLPVCTRWMHLHRTNNQGCTKKRVFCADIWLDRSEASTSLTTINNLRVHLSPRFSSRLTGLLLFLSLLSYPLSILWISLGGGGGGGGSSAPPSPPPLWLLEVAGRVQEEPSLMDPTSCAPSGRRAPEWSGREAPRGLYPACLRLSRLKMLSMLSTSLRGLHAGRYRPDPAPPEQLDLDSLLVLSASQSGCLLEGEEGALAGWWWLVEAAISDRMAAGKEEEDEEERGRLRMMLLIVSLKSRRRLAEDEKEEDDLGR